jgi:hypothetical protein
MGLSSLNARLQDPAAAMWVGGIFPKVSFCCLLLLSVLPAVCSRSGPWTLARAACCGGSSDGTWTMYTVTAMQPVKVVCR